VKKDLGKDSEHLTIDSLLETIAVDMRNLFVSDAISEEAFSCLFCSVAI
jgi:hypothetical protein